MQNKLFFILLTVVSVGLINIFAQEAPKPPMQIKSISGGVLNGKATSLTKPQYPAAAKAVRASGAVNVQVTIDEEGNIISASAVSGHPLLRQASEQAALASKFAPTLLQGQPVRVTGIIVYNFVMPMTFNQIGYELAFAEASQSAKKSQFDSISKSFPQSWEAEIQALQTLNSRLTTTVVKEKTVQVSPPTNPSTVDPPNGSYQGSTRREGIATRIGISSEIVSDENYILDNESVAILRDLQSKLETRLSVRENILWSFKLGKILGKLKAEVASDEKTRANLSELGQLGANIPAGISESASTKIKGLAESGEQISSDSEQKGKFLRLIEELQNMRTY